MCRGYLQVQLLGVAVPPRALERRAGALELRRERTTAAEPLVVPRTCDGDGVAHEGWGVCGPLGRNGHKRSRSACHALDASARARASAAAPSSAATTRASRLSERHRGDGHTKAVRRGGEIPTLPRRTKIRTAMRNRAHLHELVL